MAVVKRFDSMFYDCLQYHFIRVTGLIYYSKFDKHQDLIFVFQVILVMKYPNSVTDK